jgi:hypothetical protein
MNILNEIFNDDIFDCWSDVDGNDINSDDDFDDEDFDE